MHRLSIGLSSLLLLAGAGQAAEINVDCDVESDYEFALTDRSVIFTRDTGTPRAIVMRQGKLFVDDRWVALSPADSKRIADYERNARAAMPLARQVGLDAADIAFTALSEVAIGFGGDPARTRDKLDKARKQLDQQLARSVNAQHFNSEAMGESIGMAVKEVMPMLVGDIVSGALGAAFSGDEARLKQFDDLDKQIEARIQPRADALEVRAQALCKKMEALDAIDSALEFRLADGRSLDLLRIDPPEKHRKND
ncbi:Protein of unknown function (DUF2884) [Luteimonas cucumeris]|uniref:DUF2884 family protein n=1 Tax=Luteimonas cucumeris TaxID=985012 RepID=A0A562LEL6_9GAMM|nr:DUF2884 family protein [Luteimonas cucumeris]TWI06025.1 Protein of unknown function (DUF2884) [Luteimonas cucumeris]